MGLDKAGANTEHAEHGGDLEMGGGRFAEKAGHQV